MSQGQVQPPKAPTGMAYGAHQESIAAQQAVPLPQAAPTPGPAGATPPPSPAGPGRMAAALDAAAAHPAPAGLLAMSSTRPQEPVTAGLTSGPGPGPERLVTSRAKISSIYERLAYTTGDPDIAILAQMARGYNT